MNGIKLHHDKPVILRVTAGRFEASVSTTEGETHIHVRIAPKAVSA